MKPASLLLALLLAAVPMPAPERTPDDFFQSFTDQWVRFHTDLAAALRYFTGAEQEAFERQIQPRTREVRSAELRLARQGLQELRSFDRAKMTPTQQLSADIIAWDLEDVLSGARFDDFAFPLVQTYGPLGSLPGLLTVQHPMAAPRDAENYVVRLAQVGPRMNEAVAAARRLAGKKLVAPKFILQAALRQVDQFIQQPPARNAFVTTFASRMQRIQNLPAARQAELRAAAEKITAEQIYPAWKKAKLLLEAELPKASDEAGLWRLPGGSAAYEFLLRHYTTTKMPAEEIHQTGLRMVAEIEGRMDTLLRQMGRTAGPVRERMDRLRADQAKFAPTPEGRAEYSAEIAKIIREAEERAKLLFDRVPKAPVVAQAYPEFMGPRAASYSRAAPDGSRPGTYQFPVYGVEMTRFGMRSVAYHEAVPGHHFQIAMQMEDTTLPRFRKEGIFGSNSANTEGWGLYAERLAAESGWYDNDPVGLLGQLDAAIFRARRLVVDTGMHAKHWSRQQAIDYLGPNPAGSAVAEIERYVVMPGQACSYMIGELKIVELRERARRELGSRFSLREFHTLVLGTGRVPLDVLEQQVNRWIEAKKA